MNNEFSWTRLAEPTSERRYFIMRTPVLVAVVIAVHAVAIGSVMFIQGCGTKKPAMVEPPPAPIMPPKHETQQAPEFKPVSIRPSRSSRLPRWPFRVRLRRTPFRLAILFPRSLSVAESVPASLQS